MRNYRLFRYLLLFTAILIAHPGKTQSFQYKSLLPEIKSDGFYKIVLQPALIAKCQDGLGDLRILSPDNKQIPYILQTDPPEFKENHFVELPLLSVNKAVDKQTHIVIQNPLNKTISELLLVIKNTDADRNVSISGSDDNKQWFIIKENILLYNLSVPGKDRFVQYVDFPTSLYKFFKIIINGENLLPVNIVKAGIYDGTLKPGNYTALPAPSIIQRDSTDNASYVTATFNDKYRIDKLELKVEGPKFFRRRLRVLNNDNPVEEITSFILRSDTAVSYPVHARTTALKCIIENEDNQPLKIVSINAYQLNNYVWAYLELGGRYQLAFGDSTAPSPKYDLAFFRDRITNPQAEVNPGPVVRTQHAASSTTPAVTKLNTIVLWSIIGSVLVLLLILTIRMTKDVKTRGNEQS